MELTWEQKLEILKAGNQYGDFSCKLIMRKPGNWYVSDCHLEIAENGLLHSPTEEGISPADAVNQHWDMLKRKILKSGSRYIKWNGFMWVEITI